jgi:hypothetical protein
MRDAKRELSLDALWGLDDTGAALCEHLTGPLTSPNVAAVRVEVRRRLAEALDKINATDREVLLPSVRGGV